MRHLALLAALPACLLAPAKPDPSADPDAGVDGGGGIPCATAGTVLDVVATLPMPGGAPGTQLVRAGIDQGTVRVNFYDARAGFSPSCPSHTVDLSGRPGTERVEAIGVKDDNVLVLVTLEGGLAAVYEIERSAYVLTPLTIYSQIPLAKIDGTLVPWVAFGGDEMILFGGSVILGQQLDDADVPASEYPLHSATHELVADAVALVVPAPTGGAKSFIVVGLADDYDAERSPTGMGVVPRGPGRLGPGCPAAPCANTLARPVDAMNAGGYAAVSVHLDAGAVLPVHTMAGAPATMLQPPALQGITDLAIFELTGDEVPEVVSLKRGGRDSQISVYPAGAEPAILGPMLAGSDRIAVGYFDPARTTPQIYMLSPDGGGDACIEIRQSGTALIRCEE